MTTFFVGGPDSAPTWERGSLRGRQAAGPGFVLVFLVVLCGPCQLVSLPWAWPHASSWTAMQAQVLAVSPRRGMGQRMPCGMTGHSPGLS